MPCWDKLTDGQTARLPDYHMTAVNQGRGSEREGGKWQTRTTIVTYALVTENKLCSAKFRTLWQPSAIIVQVLASLNQLAFPFVADIIEAHKNQQLCSLTGVEGGHSLGGSLAVLRTLYAIGVRYMTLTSTCHTPWADSSSADAPTFNMKHGGLTIFGKVSPYHC